MFYQIRKTLDKAQPCSGFSSRFLYFIFKFRENQVLNNLGHFEFCFLSDKQFASLCWRKFLSSHYRVSFASLNSTLRKIHSNLPDKAIRLARGSHPVFSILFSNSERRGFEPLVKLPSHNLSKIAP